MLLGESHEEYVARMARRVFKPDTVPEEDRLDRLFAFLCTWTTKCQGVAAWLTREGIINVKGVTHVPRRGEAVPVVCPTCETRYEVEGDLLVDRLAERTVRDTQGQVIRRVKRSEDLANLGRVLT